MYLIGGTATGTAAEVENVPYITLEVNREKKQDITLITGMDHILQISDDTRPLLHIGRWGQSGWIFITACVFVYPLKADVDSKHSMRQFLTAISKIMPCSICRNHFSEAIQTLEPALKGRKQLLQWVCDTRNEINDRNGKPFIPLHEMMKLCTSGSKKNPFIHCTWRTISMILLILLLVVVYLKVKKK